MSCPICSLDKHSLAQSARCDGIRHGYLRPDGTWTGKGVDRASKRKKKAPVTS